MFPVTALFNLSSSAILLELKGKTQWEFWGLLFEGRNAEEVVFGDWQMESLLGAHSEITQLSGSLVYCQHSTHSPASNCFVSQFHEKPVLVWNIYNCINDLWRSLLSCWSPVTERPCWLSLFLLPFGVEQVATWAEKFVVEQCPAAGLSCSTGDQAFMELGSLIWAVDSDPDAWKSILTKRTHRERSSAQRHSSRALWSLTK